MAFLPLEWGIHLTEVRETAHLAQSVHPNQTSRLVDDPNPPLCQLATFLI